jgi:hypothetical protein
MIFFNIKCTAPRIKLLHSKSLCLEGQSSRCGKWNHACIRIAEKKPRGPTILRAKSILPEGTRFSVRHRFNRVCRIS